MLEQTTTSRDGTTLFYRHWPVSGSKKTVLIVHGYAEHSGRYVHVADYLNAEGIEVFAMDLRGHGKSAGNRGYIGRFSDYHEDLLAMVKQIGSTYKVENLFLLGHSMGGLVVLSTLLNHEVLVKGVILTSPFVGMSMKVPPTKALLGRLVSAVYPSLTLPNDIPPEALSRDRAVGEAYRTDPLVFKTATARWFTETMGAIDDVFVKAPGFKLPCLFLQAGDERIADVEASRRLFKALGAPEKIYAEYDAFCHEILNENGKEKCLEDISEWLRSSKQA